MENNIQQIATKILKEADVREDQYSAADRIYDINQRYLMLIEQASQVQSNVPMRSDEPFSEEFVIPSGDQTLTRTIPFKDIRRLDFAYPGSDIFYPVKTNPERKLGNLNIGEPTYFADEKFIYLQNAIGGTIRATYSQGGVTLFTVEDLELTENIPVPEMLEEIYRPLLWIYPSLIQARKYSPDRVDNLEAMYGELYSLFYNKYVRQSVTNTRFKRNRESNR